MRVRGPEGPEDEQSPVFAKALASATICFSRFSQKSRFSWHNLCTLMTIKMHGNFSRVSYLRYEHRVKKLDRFIDRVKSYGWLKFCKNAVFVSKWVTTISRPDSLSLDRGHLFVKSHQCLIEHNFSSIIAINLIDMANDR